MILVFKPRTLGRDPHSEDGVALLVALIALSVLTLAGFYMMLNATCDLRISDNQESGIRAAAAARAGLNHARELIRSLPFDALLCGPDNTYSADLAYLARAREFAFRNPVSWAVARSLDVEEPAGYLSGLPDDGIINTGSYGGNGGTPLIPTVGIAQTEPNPQGSGLVVTARYFVKVTDNNGDASELAQDPSDHPFVDGDGIIIIRSMGVARTIREQAGDSVRGNSIAVVEGRFKRRSSFNLDAALVIQGNAVSPSAAGMFEGTQFEINGGTRKPGLATIDVNQGDTVSPSQQIVSQVAKSQTNNIKGLGDSPSVSDITGEVSASPDKALLLDPGYLNRFVSQEVPRFADEVFSGNQEWIGDRPPDIGTYNPTKPATDPAQKPRVTMVDGDLCINGTIVGGGLLVVRGRLYGSGQLSFNGLVLLIGSGDLNLHGLSLKINGGLYLVRLTAEGNQPVFGTPSLTISGDTAILENSEAVEMGVRLIPPIQIGWREITPTLDP